MDQIDLVYRVARCLAGPDGAPGLVEAAYEGALANVREARRADRLPIWLLDHLIRVYRAANPRARLELLVSADDAHPLQALGAAPLADTDHALDGERAEAPLKALTPTVRLAVWLLDVERFTLEQVAEILGSTADEVGARVHRGRAAIARRALRPTPMRLRRDA